VKSIRDGNARHFDLCWQALANSGKTGYKRSSRSSTPSLVMSSKKVWRGHGNQERNCQIATARPAHKTKHAIVASLNTIMKRMKTGQKAIHHITADTYSGKEQPAA
jgi:hypothetical protein